MHYTVHIPPTPDRTTASASMGKLILRKPTMGKKTDRELVMAFLQK